MQTILPKAALEYRRESITKTHRITNLDLPPLEIFFYIAPFAKSDSYQFVEILKTKLRMTDDINNLFY